MNERLVSSVGLLSVLVLCVGALPVHAQRTAGAVGFGGQIGEPSGLTLKVHNHGAPSYDFLAAWSLVDDSFFLNAHAQWNSNINPENVDQDFEWFMGPGAFLVLDEEGPEDEAQIGISGRVGLNLVLDDRFEFYAQVTPRISVVPDTDGDVGGGVGFRYYF